MQLGGEVRPVTRGDDQGAVDDLAKREDQIQSKNAVAPRRLSTPTATYHVG